MATKDNIIMTNEQMITLIRKTTGPVFLPVLTANDVIHIAAVKKDLIAHLKIWPAGGCVWDATKTDTGLFLDTNGQ